MPKSLHATKHLLAQPAEQIAILEKNENDNIHWIPFQQKLEQHQLYPLLPLSIHTLQINIGKMCNQTCKHCHVDAGPDRKEMMSMTTMEQCLQVLKTHPQFHTVDITGGAPEMHPQFRWFVEQIHVLGRKIIVRCNLTILLANKKYHDLPQFYKANQIEVVSSLPFYKKERTDRQRGDGVFDDSIQALHMLNAAGYGIEGSGLFLHLVYNPAGAFLPADQSVLEKEFKSELLHEFGIHFNQLYTITNLPISRYLDYLLQSGNYAQYMNKLVQAFNPTAAKQVMCRSMLSISWDGFIYDCDFNQMLDLKVNGMHRHISEFDIEAISQREIIVNQHCFGCTAGAGSSCGGAIA